MNNDSISIDSEDVIRSLAMTLATQIANLAIENAQLNAAMAKARQNAANNSNM